MEERSAGRVLRAFAAESSNSGRRVGANISLAVSAGSLVAWFSVMFNSVTAYVLSVDGPEAALNRAYYTTYLVFVVFCFVLYRQNRGFQALVERSAPSMPLSILLALGSLVLSYSGISEDTVWILVIVGAILCALSSITLFAVIGQRFGMLSYKERLLYSIIAFMLASVLIAVFMFFIQVGAAVVAIVIALLSGIGLMANTALSRGSFEMASAIEDVDETDYEFVKRRSLLARFSLMVFIWNMVMEWTRAMLIHNGINEAGGTLFVRVHAVGALLVVVLTFAIIVAILTIPKVFKLSFAYRVILIVSLCSILLVQLAFFPEESLSFPYALMSGNKVLLGMTAWVGAVALLGLVEGKTSSQIVLAVVGSWFAGLLCGFAMAGLFELVLPRSAVAFTVAQVVAACLLVGSYLIVFTERDIDFISRLMPNSQQRRFVQGCETLAKRFGLSERETEVMKLLAKGRNAAYIKDVLWISENTVTTHRKRIYQKMDVHSQQELMDMVEREYNPAAKRG